MAELRSDGMDTHGILKPLVEYREQLIHRATPAERNLRKHLKAIGIGSDRYQFQCVFGWYILDFLFKEEGVCVELDGSAHDGREDYDSKRDAWIEKCGLTVLRFDNQVALEAPQKIVDEVLLIKPKVYLRKALMRAKSSRRVDTEKKLMSQGLMHGPNNKLVNLEHRTAKNLKMKADPSRIASIPMRQGSHTKCCYCQTRYKGDSVRCTGCLAIMLTGWVGPELDPPKPKKEKVLYTPRKPKSSPSGVKQLEIVSIKKGRIHLGNKTERPKCPNCSRAVSSRWRWCRGCKSTIKWID